MSPVECVMSSLRASNFDLLSSARVSLILVAVECNAGGFRLAFELFRIQRELFEI